MNARPPADLEALLAHPALAWDGWAVSRGLARALVRRLGERRPARILELGSGTSTAVLAAWARAHGAALTTVEHDPAFAAQTAGLLRALGLEGAVDLVHAACTRGGPAAGAYDLRLEGTFDFVFVDGPPLAVGRGGVLPGLWPHLGAAWEVWLKDGCRDHERACVARWQRQFAFACRLTTDHDPRGVWILTPAPEGQAVPAAPPDVGAPGERPLVSCIMPTCDRRRYVPRAIGYFLRQDYPHRELLILDDGADPVADLVPADPRIRYVRLDRRQSIGAKRNLACRMAAGELIAHWDDDDWMAPWRLSYQVEQLLARRADIAGLDRLYFFDPRGGRAWQYRYEHGRPWVAGGTLLYRKAVWQARPFPNTSNGEDTRFVWSASGHRIAAHPDDTFYAALVHPGNTSPKQTRSARWHPRPVEELQRLLGDDWAFYAGTRPDPPAPPLINDRAGDGADERVTVSIPYFRCKPFVREAVESILGQTHRALQVVVVNDGDPDGPWDALAGLDDPRLVRFDLPANRGRYFADAVVLAATDAPYFAVQDADDVSDPERVARLLERLVAEDAGAALSACYRTDARGRRRLEAFPDAGQAPTPAFRHRAHHVGLFRREALLGVGGPYGGFRIGYDTLLVNFALMAGRVAYVRQPLYTYRYRPGSLAHAAGSGLQSAERRGVVRTLRGLYGEAYAHYERHRAGALPREAFLAHLQALSARHRTAESAAALAREAARLRPLLAAVPSAVPAVR